MIQRALFLIVLGAAAVLIACTFLPLIPTMWRGIRLLDFPRLHWAVGSLIVGGCLLVCLRRAPWLTGSLLAGVIAAATVNIVILWPYRPNGGEPVAACPDSRSLSVLIANVRLGNRAAAGLIEIVRRSDPDLFLAMETDAWWTVALDPLKDRMPHGLKRITGSYYGIELYSRLPLIDGDIRHLAGLETPAVVSGVTLRTGETVDFIGLHPKPPLPWQSALGRDAELYAAAALARGRGQAGILAGDLNATPWEIAVGRTRRLSGLIDPRRDHGYVATWHAGSSWLLWPLDQIFHGGGFTTVSIEHLEAFGSDHFPYLARLCRRSDPGRSVITPEESDIAEANAVLAAAGAAERVRGPDRAPAVTQQR